MGLLGDVTQCVSGHLRGQAVWQLSMIGFGAFFVIACLLNIASQLLRRKSSEPPLVFHWIPFIGSTVTYGMDPYKFFFRCREQYGDVFTFILLGKKTTVCLGTKGNDFILNGKLKDVNAEEIYSPLTTPVFGHDVVYDCPNSKLMEQKKFVKFGLTTEALRSYVQLIAAETKAYTKTSAYFKGDAGNLDVPKAMAELTIYTASRSLQGKEVRERFDSTFADLYHDLDMGFTPINFMLPWAPLPQNRRRDFAQKKMTQTYMEIIKERREAEAKGEKSGETDMIWNLMSCKYKDGNQIPDREVAHMMIALLMAGQHSSSATVSWILLRLSSRPDIAEELLKEQKAVLGDRLPELAFEDLSRLPLHAQVVKETLRIHSPIHSIMRAVKSPMPVEGTPYVIPPTHVLLAAPGVTSNSSEYFPEPALWEPHRWDNDQTAEKYEKLKPAMTAPEEEEKTDYGYGLVSKGAASPYLPFGAGRHRCIGEQFAYVQLQTILATMVRTFRFRNLDGVEGVVGTDYSSLFSRPLAPAVVHYERRIIDEKSA
ncbi:14-alpha sterol demethylase Cyp51B [Delphinella strobiligena]|nr:14-alpha sterol demethylase Cyp51B [Delphinella strobiligena]